MVNGNGSVAGKGWLDRQTAAGGLPAMFGHVDSGTVVPVLLGYLDAQQLEWMEGGPPAGSITAGG